MRAPLVAFFILLACMTAIVSCNSMHYSDDTAFVGAAQAGAPVALVNVHGKECVDLERKVGLCTVRHVRSIPLDIVMPALPFAGSVELSCTSAVLPNPIRRAFKSAEQVTLTLSRSDWGDSQRAFTCSLLVTPELAATTGDLFARIYVVLVDERYIELESPSINDSHVTLGEYARWSMIESPAGGVALEKQTAARIKNARSAYVISASGRAALVVK